MFFLFLVALSQIKAQQKSLGDKAPIANAEGDEETPTPKPLVDGEDYGWTPAAIGTLAVSGFIVLCIIIALFAFFCCKKADEELITDKDLANV